MPSISTEPNIMERSTTMSALRIPLILVFLFVAFALPGRAEKPSHDKRVDDYIQKRLDAYRKALQKLVEKYERDCNKHRPLPKERSELAPLPYGLDPEGVRYRVVGWDLLQLIGLRGNNPFHGRQPAENGFAALLAPDPNQGGGGGGGGGGEEEEEEEEEPRDRLVGSREIQWTTSGDPQDPGAVWEAYLGYNQDDDTFFLSPQPTAVTAVEFSWEYNAGEDFYLLGASAQAPTFEWGDTEVVRPPLDDPEQIITYLHKVGSGPNEDIYWLSVYLRKPPASPGISVDWLTRPSRRR